MIILNFAHPLREQQANRISQLCGAENPQIVTVATQFDHSLGYAEQAASLVAEAGLSADEWQTEQLVIVPPSLAAIACLVVAEVHGRAGYFVPIVRMSPRPDTVPPVFDVVEILDLARQREVARSSR